MIEIVRPVLRDPVHVPEPLLPRLGILVPTAPESLELGLRPLLAAPGLLFGARRLEPLREILRVPAFQPRRSRILGIVANDLFGIV